MISRYFHSIVILNSVETIIFILKPSDYPVIPRKIILLQNFEELTHWTLQRWTYGGRDKKIRWINDTAPEYRCYCTGLKVQSAREK